MDMGITFKPWDRWGRLHVTGRHVFFQPYWGKPAVRNDRGGLETSASSKPDPRQLPTRLLDNTGHLS